MGKKIRIRVKKKKRAHGRATIMTCSLGVRVIVQTTGCFQSPAFHKE